MSKKIWVACLLWLPVALVNAQFAKYSNEILKLGIGARSLAMANASVANAGDVTAGYWNPAGLTQLNTDWDLGAMHAEYFAGMAKYDYLGMAKSLNSGEYLGASIIRFGIDGIQNTLSIYDKDGNLDLDRITKFSIADYAMIMSYAKKLPGSGLGLGANAKLIYRNIGKFANAWGFGIDIGIRHRINRWLLGAVLKDATSTFNVWSFNASELEIEVLDSTFNQAPDNRLEITSPALVIGASRTISLREDFELLAEVNAAITSDKKRHTLISASPFSVDPVMGLEFSYIQRVYLRMGVGNMQYIPGFEGREFSLQPNLGIGVRIKNFTVDYALTDIGAALYSNVFSLRYSFNAKP